MDDKDNSSSDPWAGIDAGGPAEPAEDFAFSLDGVGEQAPEAFPGEVGDLADAGDLALDAAAADEAIEEVTEAFDDAIFPMTTDAASADVPAGVFSLDTPLDVPTAASDDPFASMAADADLPGFSNGDSAADAGAVESWLEEPVADGADERPLAVFPGDDVHEHESDAGASTIQSSAIQIGTGQSGIVSPSDVIPIDEWSDSETESAVDLPGDRAASGILSEDEEPVAFGGPEFDGAASDVDGIVGAAVGGLVAVGTAGGAGAEAEPVASPAKKKPKAKPAKAKGGGIGQMIGIVLGGLMALPITYAILVWGFQKDPFKFTKMVPAEVAFLLPEKFQPGFKKPTAPGSGPKLEQASSLDQLAAVPEADGEASAEPAGEPAATEPVAAAQPEEPATPSEPAVEKPAADDLFAEQPASKEPAPPAVPEPEPLDFSALEAAIAKADESFAELGAVVDPDDPARKKLLVGWYKNLAGVAEQMVMLETAAADSGRPLEKLPEQMEAVYGGIVGNETTVGDLGKLSGMWLKSKKRPVDGAVLLATFSGTRQVGPYWSSLIKIDGAEPRTVAIISRREPAASDGEQVLVTGVLFDGDVLWASDCRRLEKAPAPAEDLF